MKPLRVRGCCDVEGYGEVVLDGVADVFTLVEEAEALGEHQLAIDIPREKV